MDTINQDAASRLGKSVFGVEKNGMVAKWYQELKKGLTDIS